MFVGVKRSGPREYLQIVEDFREGKEVRHRVIANWGRLDIQRVTGALDSIATSLAQLSCEEVAKSYKSLWEVESVFRTLKDVLEIRPIFHRKESHVKGHVFCSYLALCLLIALRKSLREHSTGPMDPADKALSWDDVIRDLRSFRIVKATFSGKTYLMRTEFKGTAHLCFSAGS